LQVSVNIHADTLPQSTLSAGEAVKYLQIIFGKVSGDGGGQKFFIRERLHLRLRLRM
jgi:hypothetical protein